MPTQLTWKRTGEITMRAEPYLIIRYPGSRYACFVRDAKGGLSPLAYGLPSAEAAKAVCEEHGAYNPAECPRCGGDMHPGMALMQTVSGSPDFADGEVVTFSPGGTGNLIDCIKCSQCGHSQTVAIK